MFKITMEQIIKNSTLIETTLTSVKNELFLLKKAYNEMCLTNLKKQNLELEKQVEKAKKTLIALETANGIKQISIPLTTYVSEKPSTNATNQTEKSNACSVESACAKEAPKTNKKEKIKKPQCEKKPETEEAIHVGRLDLRVGQIMQVEKHPDADSLYVSKIQCGDPALRTVVSGLVKFVPINELQNRKVVVLCNLKPVKMRGVLSEAMVMCASTSEAVEVLSPPEQAEPGDLIECDGYPRQPDAQLNPKKKIFETVAPDLKTNDVLQACYKGSTLIVPGKGVITSKSLKNVNIK